MFLRITKNVKFQKEILRYHSCEEYEIRLNECKDVLKNITLEDLYKDKKIVGSTMNKDHVPKLMGAGETLKKIQGSSLLKDTIKDILAKK